MKKNIKNKIKNGVIGTFANVTFKFQLCHDLYN